MLGVRKEGCRPRVGRYRGGRATRSDARELERGVKGAVVLGSGIGRKGIEKREEGVVLESAQKERFAKEAKF